MAQMHTEPPRRTTIAIFSHLRFHAPSHKPHFSNSPASQSPPCNCRAHFANVSHNLQFDSVSDHVTFRNFVFAHRPKLSEYAEFCRCPVLCIDCRTERYYSAGILFCLVRGAYRMYYICSVVNFHFGPWS